MVGSGAGWRGFGLSGLLLRLARCVWAQCPARRAERRPHAGEGHTTARALLFLLAFSGKEKEEELVVTDALWATTELRESGAESGCGDVGEVAAMSSADL